MMLSSLFSVVVVTYNQENLVLETLESIYNQTYKNIELVISDDASSDSTKEVIEKWLMRKGDRFTNVITSFGTENKGISGNHANGLKLANGEFVKYIGGDDILLPDAVEKMYNFLFDNRGARFCTAIIRPFYDSNRGRVFLDDLPDKRIIKKLRSSNVEQQFRIVAKNCVISAPGTFFRKSIFEDFGYPDESFRTFEDWHEWLKFLLNGERLYVLNEYAVLFRKHPRSLSTSAIYSGNRRFYEENLRVYKEYVLPNIDKLSMAEVISIYSIVKLYAGLLKYGVDRQTYTRLRYYRMLDPLWWLELPHSLVRKIRYELAYKKMFSEESK